MTPVTLHRGDCLEVLKTLADCSIDAVVTDPPYELGFMGKGWDATGIANNPALWAEVLRVLKPGGHMVAFSGTRTYHRMACAIEDAGFEIRDQIKFDHESGGEAAAFLASLNDEQRAQFAKLCERDDIGQLAWVYGQGFPKSHDVSKAIDKAAGAEREVVGTESNFGATRLKDGKTAFGDYAGEWNITAAAATAAARQWSGWGTALKPAWEPICLARKPLSEPTVAANVLRWGTGALNIDATRIEGGVRQTQIGGMGRKANPIYGAFENTTTEALATSLGRWPANLCHDGSQEVLDLFPETGPSKRALMPPDAGNGEIYPLKRAHAQMRGHDDSGGSAARFFYCAKASKADRAGSRHPTVKPVALMRWLCRMITPPGGTVLDPFAGSGTTGQAALKEGFCPVLIEREDEYADDIERRLGLKAPSSIAAE